MQDCKKCKFSNKKIKKYWFCSLNMQCILTTIRGGVKNGKISQYLQRATKVPLSAWVQCAPSCGGHKSVPGGQKRVPVDTDPPSVPRHGPLSSLSDTNPSSTRTLPLCPFNGTRHVLLGCFDNCCVLLVSLSYILHDYLVTPTF